MTNNRTIQHVEAQMRAKFSSLTLAGFAMQQGFDVADDESGCVSRGAGINAADYLRELVLETKTPESVEYSDFVLTIGGPSIWVRAFVHPEVRYLCGTSAGLPETIEWVIDGQVHHDAAFAVDCLLDYDVMDEGKDQPSWTNNTPPF